MPRRSFFVQLVALAALILFSWCLVRLLLFRDERGDVYPAYSTLRADPLGTRAFYEALQANGFAVRRGYHSLHRELEAKPDSIYYLALSVDDIMTFDKEEVPALDNFVRNGGRVIITFEPEEPVGSSYETPHPLFPKGKKTNDDGTEKKERSPGKTSSEKGSDENASPPGTAQEKYERDEFQKEKQDDPDWDRDHMDTKYHRSLAALWGFGWGWQAESSSKKKTDSDKASSDDSSSYEGLLPEVYASRQGQGTLDASVPWKSALYFTRLEPDWSVLYKAKDKPVLISRHLGRGEIFLATDTYFLSNEALRNERCPNLLSFVAGSKGALLFDEVHLGTKQEEGVMALVEKFRLEGYLYGVAVVFVLLLWRNSVPLVPPHKIGQSLLNGSVSGKDSRSGLINLLRRNIPVSEILKVSFAEWKRGVAPGQLQLKPKVAAMESIINEKESRKSDEIVSAYHELCAINSPNRNKGTHATKP